MPRVHKQKKSTRGQTLTCVVCQKPIMPGEEFYTWTFYKAKPTNQHTSHGYPKKSQLTRSNMSEAYAAIEGAEVDIAAATTPDELRTALETCKDSLESVQSTYQDGFDNMPQGLQESETGQNSETNIEALQTTMDEIDTAIGNIEDFDDTDATVDGDEAKAEKMEEYRTEANEAIALEA